MSALNDMGINVVENDEESDDDEEEDKEPEPQTRGRGRPARRRRPPPRRGGQEGADRPHRRPGPHVPARDGRGGIALPRGRDRHRQAHRGRPRHDDLGPVRKPDHLQRHHRLVQRPQRRPHAAARDHRPRGDAVEGPDRRAADRDRGRRRRRPKARSARRSPAPRSRKRKRSPTSPRPAPTKTTRTWSSGAPSRRPRGRGRGQHALARPDGRDAQAPGAREIRRDHLDLQEILQGPGDRMDALAGRQDFPASDEKKYQKLREQLTAEVESVQFHGSQDRVSGRALYSYNRRLTGLGGQMLRLAERHRVPRRAFLESYMGHELDENWLEGRLQARQEMGRLRRRRGRHGRAHPRRDQRHRDRHRHLAQRVPPDRQPGPEGGARGAHRQEGNGRGQPPPRHLHRQEIHQPRPAVPRPHPGREHRPDEGGR